jgi:hypothetical protein
VFRDEEGKGHLSAKAIMGNKAEYRHKQDLFYEEVAQCYGLERGKRTAEQTNEEKRKHLDNLTFKAECKKQEIEQLEEQGKVIIEQAEEQADIIETEAHNNAEHTRWCAEMESEDIIKEAHTKAEELTQGIQEKHDKLTDLYERVESNPKAQIEMVSDLRIQKLTRENQSLRSEISRLKAFEQKALELIEKIQKTFKHPKLEAMIDNFLGREKELDYDEPEL